MELIYFTSQDTPCPQRNLPEGVSIRCCTDFNTFIPKVSRSTVFIVALAEQEAAVRVIHALRNEPRTGLQPIFTKDQLGDTVDGITDGRAYLPQEVVPLASDILERLGQLDDTLFTTETGDLFRILGYMFSRPGTPITPQRLWANQSYYSYLGLEAMLGSPALVASRLADMCDRQLILRSALIDRLRHCPACTGAHLNYIDCCPNCNSINILQKPFLHCFTCGTVAPEDRFVEKDVLQCPNCTTRLRHIGADYDRPLENYECQGCNHVFIEPEVQAHCMHCGAQSPPDTLVPEQIFSYELTALGSQIAKSGTMEDLFALLDTVNTISPSTFMQLVSWMLDVANRYPDEYFTIIGIKLTNLLELDARFGKQVTAELLDSLAQRLRELVRSTDLTTRTGHQMFWILLPKTGVSTCQVVLDRILEVRNMAHRVEGAGLGFETVVFNAPEDLDLTPGGSGRLLLARLEGEIE